MSWYQLCNCLFWIICFSWPLPNAMDKTSNGRRSRDTRPALYPPGLAPWNSLCLQLCYRETYGLQTNNHQLAFHWSPLHATLLSVLSANAASFSFPVKSLVWRGKLLWLCKIPHPWKVLGTEHVVRYSQWSVGRPLGCIIKKCNHLPI